MDAALATRIERNIDRAASALFGGAAGFAAFSVLGPTVGEPMLAAGCAGVAAVAYLLCVRTLTAVVPRKHRHPVPIFDLRQIEPSGLDELVLTDADRIGGVAAAAEEPLVLDDVLAQLAPDSRVVRLFDRKTMPTPGKLKDRIDSHLNRPETERTADASQALSEALAELRRSLR